MRISAKVLESKTSIVNSLSGFGDNPDRNTIGSYTTDGENAGYIVRQRCSPSGSVHTLYVGNARECAAFLDGMIEARRTPRLTFDA